MRLFAALSQATLCLSLLGLAVAPPATAAPLFPNVVFVTSVTDDADYAAFGFLDIRSLALGEPGDGTVVFRFEVNDIADAPPASPVPRTCTPSVPPAPTQCSPGAAALNVFYTVNDKGFRSGVDATGAAGSTNPFDSATCPIEGNFLYCSMGYATLGAAVGDTITGIDVISYEGSAQDYAPGGTYAEETAKSGGGFAADLPTGTDYVLTGGTASGPIRLNVTTAQFSAGLTAPVPTNATYVYAWNNTFAAVNVTADAQVDGGNATVTVVDNANRTVASISVTATKRTSVLVPTASKGPWTVTLNYTAFKGRLNVTIQPPPAPSPVPTLTSSSTSPQTTGSGSTTTASTTSTSTTKTPALGLLALVGLLGAAAVTVRRRL